MFEIKEEMRVKITSAQSFTGTRKGDGEPQRLLRLGVSLETGCETLTEFSPTLLQALFMKDEAVQGDLVDKDRRTKLVHGSAFKEITHHETTEGAQVSFSFGTKNSVDFESAHVSKTKISWSEGGSVKYQFYVEGPQTGKQVGNAHDFLVGSEAGLTLILPKPAEDTQAELDV